MTITAVQIAAGAAIQALRRLVDAIADERLDGEEFRQTVGDRHIRIVIDEALGVLEFVTIGENGAPEESLEAVIINPALPTFGALLSMSDFSSLTPN